ncbi:MAG: biotin--[acetyl-CoA-carboxylase] ligase, partial [Acidobacteriaceae bacterium]|nr:biotin--[acetyl-CoA-carboxylase] ligase [Acidobacteriaceae bacterium]
DVAPADALWLSLVAGIAAHDAVLRLTGSRADIRWPNDLLIGEKKFGGILTELNADATRVRFAVIGIGINVNHPRLPESLTAEATSLRIFADHEFSRQALLVEILRSLDREVNLLTRASGLPERQSARRDILIRFESVSTWVRGRRVRVAEGGGYSGVTAGLDGQGFLLVETKNGLRRVLSGGVRNEKE